MAERQDTGSNSPWRILLTFAFLAFTLIRIAMTCSRTNQPTQSVMPELQQLQQQQHEMMSRQRDLQKTMSNQMMYADYKALDSLDDYSKRMYGIHKIEKDSVIHFDLSSDFRLERGLYLQNNMDDSLKIAIRTPEMSIFFHDFTNHNGDEYNLRSIKRGLQPNHFKEDKLEKLKAYTYTLTKNNNTFNGYVVILGDKDYASYAEFESAKLNKSALRTKALLFLFTHIKTPVKGAAN